MSHFRTFYVLICRDCGDDLEMPFMSAVERGEWATLHRQGTGHSTWLAFDVKRLAKSTREIF